MKIVLWPRSGSLPITRRPLLPCFRMRPGRCAPVLLVTLVAAANATRPESAAATSAPRTGRLLGLPPPPPPPPPASSAAALDDADRLAVYDYSGVRSDLAHYSRTLDTMFGLLVALLGLLLVPLLAPLLVTAAKPWLLDIIADALAER